MWRGCLQALRANTPQYASGLTAEQHTPSYRTMSQKLSILRPKRTVAFTLADGTTIERAVSECHLALPEGEGHTPVILGEAGDEALLGVVTLEIFGLILHPFKRTLEPMRMLLA